MPIDNHDMVFVGERYVPGLGGQIAYEHLHRYALASDYISGKTVLDIASGEGYGSCLLAKTASYVIGVDVSSDAVEHARIKYGAHKNIDFRIGSCTAIPLPDTSVDVVVSFETIEHIADHEKMMREVKRVLKPDGILIISSPNKKTYSDDPCYRNEYHVHELYRAEFIEMLNKYFAAVTLCGQRLIFSSHIWPLDDAVRSAVFAHYSGNDAAISRSLSTPFEALYFIALCANMPISPVPISLFTHADDHLFKWCSKLPADLAAEDKQLAAKEVELAVKSNLCAMQGEQLVAMQTQLAAKEAELAVKSNQCAMQGEQLVAMQTQLTAKEAELAVKSNQCAVQDTRIVELQLQVQQFLNSKSWRLTKPLRLLYGRLKKRNQSL